MKFGHEAVVRDVRICALNEKLNLRATGKLQTGFEPQCWLKWRGLRTLAHELSLGTGVGEIVS